MNLISNTCIGAYLYKLLNLKFENPFCWSVIDFDSMYYLIKNYEKINFKNYELTKTPDWWFTIIIDNDIKVHYVHYKFDKNANKPTRCGSNIIYNKIWEYIVEKYEERLTRMHGQPIFVIGSIHPCHWYTENEIYKICEICKKKNYKLIIANNNMDFSEEFPEFIFIKTKYTEKDFNNDPFTKKEIYPQIREYIKC